MAKVAKAWDLEHIYHYQAENKKIVLFNFIFILILP
jgi:hypothetical protein